MNSPCDEALLRSPTAPAPCAPKSRPWILAAAIVGSSMAFIDSTVVNVALPALQASFHATVVDVQWVVESYGLLLAALILVGGSFGDLFGRRLVFLLGVALFALASAACGVSLTIHQLILARSIQGVGAALLVPGSLAILSSSFDEKSRGQAIGTWSGFTSITTALGPVLGGWLIQHGSWRWVFFINLPLAAVVVILSLRHVPESRGATHGKVDWPGASLVTLGLAGLVTAFIESENTGWSRAPVLIGLLAGSGCLILFLLVEARAKSPMVPLTLFRSSAFTGSNLLTLFLYAAVGIFFFLFPLDLIQVRKYSPTATGAAMLPMILLMFLLSRWSGGLVARRGSRLPLAIGPLVVALGFALFSLPSLSGGYWTTFFPAIVVLGLGMAITVAPLTTVVMNAVNEDRVGAASGINNAVARLAGVLAIAVLGVVMVHAFGAHLHRTLAQVPLSPQLRAQLEANEIKLAGLEAPAALSPGTRDAIAQSVDEAFIFGFRIIMWTCAALSLASAAIAWRMIPRNTPDLSHALPNSAQRTG